MERTNEHVQHLQDILGMSTGATVNEAPAKFSESEMIALWKDFWKGGYNEGDPLDPFARSSYAQMGMISVLHAIYQVCIKPNATSEKRILEIGPGQGAWTKTMLTAKEVWCLDVNSAEFNNFWQHLGEETRKKVRYIQVDDFACRGLPDEYFDFLFSFGTFCHIPVEGQHAYFRNLFPKMVRGGLAAVMIADYDKYNAAVESYGNLSISFRRYPPLRKIRRRLFDLWSVVVEGIGIVAGRRASSTLFDPMGYRQKSKMDRGKGAWFHAGIQDTCRFVESIGWEVVSPDLGLCVRDPLVLLRRPA